MTNLINSNKLGSMDLSPTVMLISVGKNVMSTVTARIGLVPTPMMGSGSSGPQFIALKMVKLSGAKTTMGIVCAKIARGKNVHSAYFD